MDLSLRYTMTIKGVHTKLVSGIDQEKITSKRLRETVDQGSEIRLISSTRIYSLKIIFQSSKPSKTGRENLETIR